MTAEFTRPNRRQFLTATAMAGAVGVFMPRVGHAATTASATSTQPAGDDTIRPFRIHIEQEAIDDLRRRIAATRWPDKETVNDHSQGVPLAKLKPLIEYWGTDYDWRNGEAKLNALSQFVTTIDGLDIQFAHVRSKHANALPLIMTHGWPGSLFELLKVVGPLTDPTAYGGRAEDAFHLVLPTYPHYGFSGKPTGTDWGPDHVARAWDILMLRLGYDRYVAQGGDWGAIISEVMAVQAPPALAGIHINMPGTTPPDVLRMVKNREPVPEHFSKEEKAAYARLRYFYDEGFGYAALMNTRPQTLGYSLADSPVGMAAFYYDKFAEWSHSGGDPETVFTRDEILDAISLYWADQYRRLLIAVVLGCGTGWRRTVQCGRDHEGARRRDGLPGRNLSGAEELGGEDLQQTRLLERRRQGRPLCRLGTADDFH